MQSESLQGLRVLKHWLIIVLIKPRNHQPTRTTTPDSRKGQICPPLRPSSLMHLRPLCKENISALPQRKSGKVHLESTPVSICPLCCVGFTREKTENSSWPVWTLSLQTMDLSSERPSDLSSGADHLLVHSQKCTMDKLSVLFYNQSKLDMIYYVLQLAQYTTHICIFCKFTKRKNVPGYSFRRHRKEQDKSFLFTNKRK